jgi:hypothetical protein
MREERILKVFENRMLRRIFGPKREEVVGGCERPHSEELRNFYTSEIIIRAMKSRNMGWARHVVHIGEMRKIICRRTSREEATRNIGA